MGAIIEIQPTPYPCRLTSVRPATEADFPILVEMARHFYDQTAYQSVPFSGAGAEGQFHTMLSHGLLFVAEYCGLVVGVIGGLQFPFVFNPDFGSGAEMIMWVEPDYRRGGAAGALMDAIEHAARDAGLSFWSMMSLEAVRPEAADRIYKRRGYKLAEHTYVKEF